VSVPAAWIRWQGFATMLRWPGAGRTVASTAGFNMSLFGALGLGGVLLARRLGPTARGEYAAITAWLDVALIIGQCGQPDALCFYVARDPGCGRQYVATSRSLMLVTGVLVLIAGVLFAPLLAHGNSGVTAGYRIACGAAMAALAGTGYVSSLQARDLHRWNVVGVSQPLLSLTAITALGALRLLTLHSALTVLAATLLLQALYAYCCCRFSGLAPGASEAALVGPLASYGLTQLAALAPTTFNAQLGQLVPPADLGRYAIAVSLTLLPMPLVVGDLLRGRNQLAVVAWSQGPAAVFLVVLLIVLLPGIDVMGAAISSTVAYGIALALMLWWLRRLPVVSAGPARTSEARVVESNS
jgi:O-antigen/teichoic acid export membrane protein